MKMTLKTIWNLRMRATTKANDLKSLPKMKKPLGSAVQLSSLFLFICSVMPDQNRSYLWLAKAKKEHGLLQISDQTVAEMQASITIKRDEIAVVAEEKKQKKRRHDLLLVGDNC